MCVENRGGVATDGATRHFPRHQPGSSGDGQQSQFAREVSEKRRHKEQSQNETAAARLLAEQTRGRSGEGAAGILCTTHRGPADGTYSPGKIRLDGWIRFSLPLSGPAD